MFNQQNYINEYIKNSYKSIKLRIKKDNKMLINKLESVDNINQYLIDLIIKDINNNRIYSFIDNNVKIDFELSKTMKLLIEKAEEADYLGDYGLYMNLAYAIDAQAKNETKLHIISESNWRKLIRRYKCD